MILEALKTALSNIDWDFATPSPIRYDEPEPETGEQTWQERLIAYELYHQLRLLWEKEPALRANCVIHAEPRKGYQHIKGFDYMPDFLFHLPQPRKNRAVVEVKLAHRDIAADLNKLMHFHKEFEYDDLVEILVGKRSDFDRILSKHTSSKGTLVHLLHLSPKTKWIAHECIQVI